MPSWFFTFLMFITPLWGPVLLVSIAELISPLGKSSAFSVVIFVLPVAIGSIAIFQSSKLSGAAKFFLTPLYLLFGAMTCGISAWGTALSYGHR